MACASEGGNSFSATDRRQSALAASISSKSGAYRLTVPIKKTVKRFSAPELPLSGRNHFSATLASTTQFRIGGLFLHGSIRSYLRELPLALESVRADGGSDPTALGCAQEVLPFSFCRSPLVCSFWASSLLVKSKTSTASRRLSRASSKVSPSEI